MTVINQALDFDYNMSIRRHKDISGLSRHVLVLALYARKHRSPRDFMSKQILRMHIRGKLLVLCLTFDENMDNILDIGLQCCLKTRTQMIQYAKDAVRN